MGKKCFLVKVYGGTDLSSSMCRCASSLFDRTKCPHSSQTAQWILRRVNKMNRTAKQKSKWITASTILLLDTSVLRIISSACTDEASVAVLRVKDGSDSYWTTAVFNQRSAAPAGDPSGGRTADGPKFKRVISAPFPPKKKSQLISPTVTWPITSKP